MATNDVMSRDRHERNSRNSVAGGYASQAIRNAGGRNKSCGRAQLGVEFWLVNCRSAHQDLAARVQSSMRKLSAHFVVIADNASAAFRP